MNKIEGAVNKISSPSLSDFGQQGM